MSTLFFETTLARPRAVQQVLHYQVAGLGLRQLGQGQGSAQQFPDVGKRQHRQSVHFQQLLYLRVCRTLRLPVQPGLRNEPRRQDGQRELMLPGAILDSLTLVPPQLRLGVLDRALHEVALHFHARQLLQRAIRGRIAQGVGYVPIGFTPQDQPLLRRLLIAQRPYTTRGVGALQLAAGGTADPQRAPPTASLS